MGHSAGAHMAALLAADERYLENAGVDPARIVGVVGLAGPYHFTPLDADLRAIFGPEDNFPNMQASTFVDGTEPPIQMLYGLEDDVVGRSNITRYARALDRRGGCYEIREYDGEDHISILAAFTWVYRETRPILDDAAAFIARARAGRVCNE